MTRYLFILGRNPDLSMAEIYSYLEARKINFEVLGGENNILMVEAEIEAEKMINSLGGTIAIGRVLISGNKEKISEYINKNEIYTGEEIKFNYSFLELSDSGEGIKEAIKQKFRQEGLKANLRNPELTPEKLRNLVNYFIFEDNLGIIEQVYDTHEAEKRDMKKPVRRPELTISLRLAKILVNLSQTRENETLLDPFSGIGTILQEAVLQGINVIGMDKDRKACENAEKNLAWLEKNYKIKGKWEIINNDSKNIKIRQVDGVACEPDLGEILKKSPRRDEAYEMIKDFEKLMISVLENVKKYLKPRGKIAFTSPAIWAGGTRTRCNIGKILDRTGLKPAEIPETELPLKEERQGKIVSREIYVLEKG